MTAQDCPGCGKRVYLSRYAAKRGLRHWQSIHGDDGVMSVYRCWHDNGKGWHFGHMSTDARPPQKGEW